MNGSYCDSNLRFAEAALYLSRERALQTGAELIGLSGTSIHDLLISHLHRDNSWGVLIAVDNDKLLHSASAVVVAGVISARRAISRTVHAAMQVLIALGVCACAQILKWGRWLSATKKGVRVLRDDDINSWWKAL